MMPIVMMIVMYGIDYALRVAVVYMQHNSYFKIQVIILSFLPFFLLLLH